MTAEIIGPGGQVDVSDRPDRELGKVSVEGDIIVDEVTIENFPADFPDAAATAVLDDIKARADLLATEAKLEAVRALLAAALSVQGTVALDAATLAALESISAVVSGTVALDAPTLAALETINAVCSGTVALDATTLAALETINAIVTGAVSVTNLPDDFPDEASKSALDAIKARADLLASEVTLTVVRDKLGPVATANGVASSIGDTVVHTPQAGKAIRLRWICIQTPKINGAEVDVTIRIGDEVVYGPIELEPKRLWMHGTHFPGAVDDELIVELSAAQQVRVFADVEEF